MEEGGDVEADGDGVVEVGAEDYIADDTFEEAADSAHNRWAAQQQQQQQQQPSAAGMHTRVLSGNAFSPFISFFSVFILAFKKKCFNR